MLEKQKNNVVGEWTTNREKNDKTHSKVVRERTKEIHSKVSNDSVVKVHHQTAKKGLKTFWLKKVDQFKMIKKELASIFFLKGSNFIFWRCYLYIY